MKKMFLCFSIVGLMVFSIIPVSATVLEDNGGVELEEGEKKPSTPESSENIIESPTFEPEKPEEPEKPNNDQTAGESLSNEQQPEESEDSEERPNASQETESIPNDEGTIPPEDFLGVVTLTSVDGDVSVCMFGEATAFSTDGHNWESVEDNSTLYLNNEKTSEIIVKSNTNSLVCDLTE